MDQMKTGAFLKELRKEKGLTQSQLAEQFNVSDRTVSRWETGSNLPDLSLLVELADFYRVDIKEIICGERTTKHMETQEKETLKMVADYAENEKENLLKRVRIFDIVGIIAMLSAFLLNTTGTAAASDFRDGVIQCLYGFSLGVIIMNLLYTTGALAKVRSDPKKRRFMKVSAVVCTVIVVASLVFLLVLEHT